MNNIIITPSVLHGKCGHIGICTPRTDFVPGPDDTLRCKRCA